MKILVIGSGGREHALVWKLAQSEHVGQIWCAPGNAGIAGEQVRHSGRTVQCVGVAAEDLSGLLEFARGVRPDLTVVGPDNPLGAGIVDLFALSGFRIWGPNKKAAQFEASKAFSQGFMERHGIPTARGAVFSDPDKAAAYARSMQGRCAVKADGLALGKGVIVCRGSEESDRAVQQMMREGLFGEAGIRVVIQELLEGIEVSLHAICDGRRAVLFPSSQDHKRALDGDAGPNTGGMGTYSPAPFFGEAELRQCERAILGPWLRGCEAEGIDFRGILYPGVMLTEEGPKVIEFNARFGDPEAQVYLTRLETDLVELIEASLAGRLGEVPLRWGAPSSVCVVVASGGYPGKYAKGKEIRGIKEAEALGQTKVFHAGTMLENGRLLSNGGRVLGVTAWGDQIEEARARAYRAVAKIEFDGMQFRRDIAAKALRQE